LEGECDIHDDLLNIPLDAERELMSDEQGLLNRKYVHINQFAAPKAGDD
jgi:hypothetical protein